METLGTLLRRLRVERELSQERLAEIATVSGPTIISIERRGHSSIRPATARAIYKALAQRKPIHESDAALFFNLAGIDPTIVVDSDRPAQFDDITRLQELAKERIVYEPDRPTFAREAVRVMALRPGSHDGIPVSIPPVVLQIIANLIAANGPERTEQLLRSVAAMTASTSPSALPPGFVKTPPLPASTPDYTVQEVIPTAPKAVRASEKGTGPASRRRARGG